MVPYPERSYFRTTEIHAAPRIPDGSFTDWRYIHLNPGPWAEMMFTYGNDRISMTVSTAAWNHTIAGYRNLQAQLGINQAFVTLKFPGVFGKYGGLLLNVGSFASKYGTSGKYNAGFYQTYIFGRTRVAGHTLSADIWLNKDWRIILEEGLGAKIDVIPNSGAIGAAGGLSALRGREQMGSAMSGPRSRHRPLA